MDLRKLKTLIDLVEASDISELELTEGEEKVNSAKYVDGVLTIKIPITKKGKEISLD